ncbi:hypothetical protein HYH03_015038 [Edaphochlamys debaryana]|uniref:Major facilitator superfamily (MFS) profile domain-containing protein n=1 Tax=Edaphochlamys debaryana TaxID=47281 RepID=A0A835XUY0_9CHLO|nr:hypothetical protein HYH03_015038 [Edaphochlamys debaryana]|eukprot:KAG2486334.1 hypothetical protein HYH03_015038 [Edaphochlamys debaryana]
MTKSRNADGMLISVDDLIEKELGWRGFGPAQLLALLTGGLAYTMMGLVMFLMTFAYVDPLAGTGPPHWRCSNAADAACTALHQSYSEPLLHHHHRLRSLLQAPSSGNASASLLGDAAGVSPSVNDASPALQSGTPSVDVSATAAPVSTPAHFCDLSRSQYVWTDPSFSLAAEYDMICDRKWQVALLETLFFSGFMAGNGIFGPVADKYGRRSTMAACGAATAVLTALSASPLVRQGPGSRRAEAATAAAGVGVDGSGGGTDLYGTDTWGLAVHAMLRTLSGVTCAGLVLGAYVLATEVVGPTWRGAAGMLTQTFYILGEMVLVCLSLAFPAWRHLTLAIAAFGAASLALLPLVPESPRWLLLHGKPAQARAALLWIARLNRALPPEIACSAAGEVRYRAAPRQRPGSSSASAAASASASAGLMSRDPSRGKGRGSSHVDEDRSRLLGGGKDSGAWSDGGEAEAEAEEWWEEEEGKDVEGGESQRLVPAASTPAPAGPATHRPASFSAAAACAPAPLPVVHANPGDALALGLTSSLSAGAASTSPSPSASGEASLYGAVRHPVTRRLLLSAVFVMFALSVAYYGVTLALGSLAGSLHANFMLTAAAELPGYLVIAATTDRLGRRVVIGSGTALAGVACIGVALCSPGPLQVFLAMAGKLGCSGAWAVGLTFASELFPTCLRSAALALASQAGDLGGLVTPLLLVVAPAGGPWERLPFLVMGGMSLVAVAAVWRLPETRGMPQLDTFDELLTWLAGSRGSHPVVRAPSASAAHPPSAFAVQLGSLRSGSLGRDGGGSGSGSGAGGGGAKRGGGSGRKGGGALRPVASARDGMGPGVGAGAGEARLSLLPAAGNGGSGLTSVSLGSPHWGRTVAAGDCSCSGGDVEASELTPRAQARAAGRWPADLEEAAAGPSGPRRLASARQAGAGGDADAGAWQPRPFHEHD